MTQKRKVRSAQFKAKVVLEAMREQHTVNELARKYSVHPGQIHDWKKKLLEGSAGVFEHPGSRRQDAELQRVPELYEQIGRLQVELEWLKKRRDAPLTALRAMVDPQHPQLGVARQCALLGLGRSSYYYRPVPVQPYTLQVMNAIDEIYTDEPCFGVRRVRQILERDHGYTVGPERVRRLMRKMGLEAIYPRRRSLSQPDKQHRVYPYLLRGLTIDRAIYAWCSDITYLRLRDGFVYLVAVMDWYSRYVLSRRVSNTLDTAFCVEALKDALAQALPEIYNTDQGAQFTASELTDRVLAAGVRMSMDGRGRFADNIFIERLWRSLKYEDIYLKDYETVRALIEGLTTWFDRYNHWRPHQSLGYETPAQVHGCAA